MLQQLAYLLSLAALPLASGQGNHAPGMNTTTNTTQFNAMLDAYTAQFVRVNRSPILHWPEEEDLEYEALTFPAEDGVPLEAWFFPSPNSTKILYMNHPIEFTRGGLPGHLEPHNSSLAPAGNNFDINFIPDYRILRDAGYNVLVHDLRNHGHSSAAHGGMIFHGRYESRDVIGALRHIRSWERTRNMTIGMYPRCMGGNAVLYAMHRRPAEFEDMRVLVVPQPISLHLAGQAVLERAHAPAGMYDALNKRAFETLSYHLEDFSPIPWARSVRVPTYMWQVRNDPLTTPDDVQAIFDAIPVVEKQLLWLENTTRRYEAYVHFQRNPGEILNFLDRYMN